MGDSAPLVLSSTRLDLKCPSCGKRGIGRTKAAGSGPIRSVYAPDGFYITLAPNDALQVTCGACKTPVYQAR
jgi:hypothetical protein